MGKFAKAKKPGQLSSHSRAARRAASPSLDVDKSITSLKAPVDSPKYSPGSHNAGISKKTNTKRMTRAQRLRHEKGLNRADQVIDILQNKKAKSIAKEKRTKDRAGDWEDLNKKYTVPDPNKSTNAFQAIQGDDDDDEDEMSEDDTPAELKAANSSTISAQNMSRFAVPAPSVAAETLAAIPAPNVSTVDEDDIDEVL